MPILFTTKLVAALKDEDIFLGNGATYSYRTLSLSGEIREQVTAAKRRVPVDNQRFAEYVLSRYGPGGATGAQADDQVALMMERDHLDSLPAYSEIHVDPTGHVWLGEWLNLATYRGDRRSFEVFDPDGRWLGAVRMPRGLMVYEIGVDYVLGLRLGQHDESHIEVFELRSTRR